MEIIKTDSGDLEYRSPNIPEMLQLIGVSGLGNQEGHSIHYILGKIIENIGNLVDFSNLRDSDGKAYGSYEDLCKDFSMMTPLTDIANKILDDFIQGSKKKKS